MNSGYVKSGPQPVEGNESGEVRANLLHVVNFSGGLCSFWAAMRVREAVQPSDMVLLFADTLIEDEDLYAFNEQASNILGVPITRISENIGPWELFRREGLIGNSHYPLCSIRLKREPLDRWHRQNCQDDIAVRQGMFWEDERRPAVLYMGFDWNESHRLDDLRRELPGWQIQAPMTEAPYWDKCKMQAEANKLGLIVPKLYRLGFPHNNCGGRCVRAGISHFVHLYRVLPNRFLEWMQEEQLTAQVLRKRGIEPFSVLKDRRGGTVKPLWLVDLKTRIEAGETFPTDEWGGCGCGGATNRTGLEPPDVPGGDR